MDEDQPVDQQMDDHEAPSSIGDIQIFQASPTYQGETVTLSLEDAAQLIFQQQGLHDDGDGSLQPGTYQIITQAIGPGTSNQISILHAGNADQIQGFDFGSQAMFLQQPSEGNDQTTPHIIHVPETLTVAPMADQQATDLSGLQGQSEEILVQDETQVAEKDSDQMLEGPDEMADSVQADQSEHVFQMINHSGLKTGEAIEEEEAIKDEVSNPVVVTETSFPGTNLSEEAIKETVIEVYKTDPVGSSQTQTCEFVKQENQTAVIEVVNWEADDNEQNKGAEQETLDPTKANSDATQTDSSEDVILKTVEHGKVLGGKLKMKAQPDLSKPIKVFNHMEVVVGKKKCVLEVNPNTGQLCAYPLITPTASGKKRGRPKKSETKQKAVTTKPVAEKEQTNSAAEGLLELSNTGPDGIRRSGRPKKKASVLQDYEMLEVSSDDDAAADNAEDEVLPTGAIRKRRTSTVKEIKDEPGIHVLPTNVWPVKRGRGRPRRYPRPEDTPTSSQIPTMVIPGNDGQSIMMAPIQGLTNLEEFQKQVNQLIGNQQQQQQQQPQQEISTLPEVVNDGTQFLNKPVIQTEVPKSDPQLMTSITAQSVPSDTETSSLIDQPPDNESDPTTDITNEDAGLIMTVDGNFTDSLTTEEPKSTENSGPTIIQIPETLLPMFMQKKDPQKIGLKASNTEIERLKCQKCDFQAYYEQQYQSHIAEHTDDVQKCKCCPFLAFDKETLVEHFKQTHPRCICRYCDHMAEHAYIIKRHMMRHNQIGCKCEICGKIYKDQYVMKMHVKMIHEPAEVLFECTVCAKKFTRKAHLKRHLRIHDAQKPFKCPKCQYRGCEKSDISKHMLIHEDPKHVCEICGKAFRHVKNKDLHMKRHSGQRDYKCGVCDFYGYTFTDIRKHIERKHTNTKAHICDKCGAAFKSDALLRVHKAQQCDAFMIEQALSISTTDGGMSHATVKIPFNFPLDNQTIQVDSQGKVITDEGQIKIENVRLPDNTIALTADQLQAVVSQAQLTDGSQQQIGLIREIDVGQVQYTHVTDVVDGLSGDEENITDEIGGEMDETGHAMDEQIQGIGDDGIDDTDEGKVSEQILGIVTGFTS